MEMSVAVALCRSHHCPLGVVLADNVSLILEVDRVRRTTSWGPHSHLGLIYIRFWNLGRWIPGIKLVGTLGVGEMHLVCRRNVNDSGTDNQLIMADTLRWPQWSLSLGIHTWYSVTLLSVDRACDLLLTECGKACHFMMKLCKSAMPICKETFFLASLKKQVTMMGRFVDNKLRAICG